MSAVAVLTPVIVAAWPALSAAAVAAAAQLGFTVVDETLQEDRNHSARKTGSRTVQLEVPNSEIVTGTLGRDQQIRLQRNGCTAVFARDARGHATFCVSGEGHTEDELRALGEELGGRLVQQYTLQKLKTELAVRGMDLVAETVDENQAIRLTVRHWQN